MGDKGDTVPRYTITRACAREKSEKRWNRYMRDTDNRLKLHINHKPI